VISKRPSFGALPVTRASSRNDRRFSRLPVAADFSQSLIDRGGLVDQRPAGALRGKLPPDSLRHPREGDAFTKDDDLVDRGQAENAAPRDNVVLEAGYFIGLKGKRKVLIIRESGSKMPADLGGDIYASPTDRASTASIERTLAAFLDAI
jgi:hypothetical protein